MVQDARTAVEAEKKEQLRMAAREQMRALRQVIGLLERCVKASELATGHSLRAVELEFEETSHHVLKLAETVGHAAALLKA